MSPPRLADRLLRRALPADAYEIVAGDLEETYRRSVRPLRGRLRADLWFWRAALAAIRDARRGSPANPPSPPGTERTMLDLGQDLRFAVRTFRRSPGLLLAVTVTLALGVGANTAIFSVVYGTLFRPLPYPDPDRLVALNETNAERGWVAANVAGANFLDWRERADSFAAMAVHTWQVGAALTGGDRPEWVRSTSVMDGFFGLLGAHPVLGRTFTPEETWDPDADGVVIGNGLWRRYFGGDPGAVGRTIPLDGRPRPVLGVMPPGFSYPGTDTEVWEPLAWDPAIRDQGWFRRAHFLYGIARLEPGVEIAAAESELRGIAAALERQHPDTNAGMGVRVRTLRQAEVGDTRTPLLVMLGAVGAVLLIACANIANLLLARSADREREVAVRAALGAGRRRIVRQLLTESLVLAAVGGVAGLAVAYWLTGALLDLAAGAIPRLEAVAFDGVSLGFGLGITLLTGIVFGLVPALRGAGTDLRAGLHEGGRTAGPGRAAKRARSALVVAEVALALVLVSGAGLMLRSVARLASVDPGFDTDGLLAASIELPSARYPETADILGFLRTLDSRLVARPGIRSVAIADSLPLEGSNWTSDFWIEGRPIGGDRPVVEFNRRLVSGDYFRTLGVPLLAGRTFDERDGPDSMPVAIINETLAREHFGDESPIGARITDTTEPEGDDWFTVVGVVGDEKVEGLDSREWPEIMVPFDQLRQRLLYVLVRYDPEGGRPDATFREVLSALDPDLPVISSRTFEEILSGTMGTERLLTLLLSAFAALALLLAAVGVAGVVSASVMRRTREIGVRVAFGASRGSVVGMLVRQGMALVGIGIGAGLLMTLAAARVLGSLLYETSPLEPTTLLLVVFVLAGTALVAILIPARRAATLDPVRSLHGD